MAYLYFLRPFSGFVIVFGAPVAAKLRNGSSGFNPDPQCWQILFILILELIKLDLYIGLVYLSVNKRNNFAPLFRIRYKHSFEVQFRYNYKQNSTKKNKILANIFLINLLIFSVLTRKNLWKFGQLFADTELTKDIIQQIVSSYGAGNFAEIVQALFNVHGQEIGAYLVVYPVEHLY